MVARAFEPLSKAVVKQIAELGVTKIRVVDTTVDDGIVIKCMKKDPTKNEEEALKDIYRRLRPGDPPTAANARALIKRLFFDPKRYDLGRVGRYKINQKLGIKGGESRILTKEDLVAATKYLLRLKKGEGSLGRHRSSGQPPHPHGGRIAGQPMPRGSWRARSAWSRSA